MPKPPQPGQQSIFTELPNVVLSIDPDAFDREIDAQGVRLVHYSALRCPVGMTDLDDNRRPHEDHANCSNGFLYKRVGRITALLVSNSKQDRLEDIGFVHGASFTATFPRFYDECENCPTKDFLMAPFDRFYLEEEAIVVPTWQLVRMNEAGSDRTNFPIVHVERLVDWREEEYFQGDDFDVVKGQIVWRPGGRRPMGDLENGRGAIYSVRYWYRPFWYCARLLHEIRVAQVEHPTDLTRKVVRMPQQALLNREFLFVNESNDDMTKDPRSPRQAAAPEDGGFGPRG